MSREGFIANYSGSLVCASLPEAALPTAALEDRLLTEYREDSEPAH